MNNKNNYEETKNTKMGLYRICGAFGLLVACNSLLQESLIIGSLTSFYFYFFFVNISAYIKRQEVKSSLMKYFVIITLKLIYVCTTIKINIDNICSFFSNFIKEYYIKNIIFVKCVEEKEGLTYKGFLNVAKVNFALSTIKNKRVSIYICA
jgi:hypothetical protein